MKKILFATVVLLLTGIVAADAQIVRGSSSISTTSQKSSVVKSGVRYQGELNFGFATGGKLTDEDGDKWKTDFSRPFIETVHGVRMLNDYLFAGIGVGVQYAYGKMDPDYEDSDDWGVVSIPVFLNLKGYYPVSNNFAPYVSLSLGGSIFACSNWDDSDFEWENKLKGGFYCDFGVGFNYRKFNFGFGLQHQSMKFTETYGSQTEEWGSSVNSFYVKVGLKF